MLEKRRFLKSALVAAIPFSMASRAFADVQGSSDKQNAVLAILTASLEKLKRVAVGSGAGLYQAGAAPGTTDGRIAPGCIGERIAPLDETYVVAVPHNGHPVALKTLELPAGVWQIFGVAEITINASDFQYVSLAISDGGASFESPRIREGLHQTTTSPIHGVSPLVIQCARYYNANTPRKITLVARSGVKSLEGSGTWRSMGDISIYAIRIG